MTNIKIATYQERAKKLEDVLKSELPCVIRLGGTKEYPEYKLQIIEDGDHFLSKSKEIVRKIKFEWYNKYMKNNG